MITIVQARCRIGIVLIGLILFGFFVGPISETAAEASSPVVHLSMIPHRSTLGNEKAYRLLINELEKETGYSIRWTGSKTYQDVIDNIREGRADIGYVGAFAYIEAQDSFGVRLIARTLDKNKRAFYNSMIVARKDSPINSLPDLKGRSFAFTDPDSTSGFLFPMVGLRKAGLRLEDFSEVRYVKRHANSILAVVNGSVDAGAVSSTVTEKIDIDFGKIRILWKSDPIYRGPWIANTGMSDERFYRIQGALITISGSSQAADIFKDLGTKGFVPGKDNDYDNVREVFRFMQSSMIAE